MELIDTITVRHQGIDRRVMLFFGDLTLLPEEEAVDVLVVSAFPDDYAPSPRSLIGALAGAGISVAELARNKELDLRQFSSCWLSKPIKHPGIHFRRVLCFEPQYRGRAPEVVGDIFRSIVPLTTGIPPIKQLALPLVASGDQGEPPEQMLEAMTEASVHWLSVGLALDCIKIVLRDSRASRSLAESFARIKRRHAEPPAGPPRPDERFDAFISYCHADMAVVDDLVGELRSRRPAIRVFVDRHELKVGAVWQQHIFDSLEASRKVICILTPDYLMSKVCKEEYNIAMIRHREHSEGVLLPMYVFSAQLPTYMKIVQYEDVREGDREKVARSAARILEQL